MSYPFDPFLLGKEELVNHITAQILLKNIVCDFDNIKPSFSTNREGGGGGDVQFSSSFLIPKKDGAFLFLNEEILRPNIDNYVSNIYKALQQIYAPVILSTPSIINVRIDDEIEYFLVSFDGKASNICLSIDSLRYYQEEALEIMKNMYTGDKEIKDLNGLVVTNRGIIELPTAAGKTIIFLRFILWAQANINVIAAPTISLARQIENNFKEEAKKHGLENNFDYLIVCSDTKLDNIDDEEEETIRNRLINAGEATTDPKIIKNFLTSSNKPKMIFAVNKSLKKLGSCLNDLGLCADITVYDEGHRACDEGVNCTLHDETYPSRFRFFFTATVKEKVSNTNNLLKYPMSNKEYFGGILYKKTPTDMIKEGFILPLLFLTSTIDEEITKKIHNFLICVDIEDDLRQEAALFISGLIEVYRRVKKIKTIAYVQSINTANWYKENFDIILDLIKKIVDEENIIIQCDVISQKIQGTDRIKMINRFDQAENAILFNYQVIKEGIDVKSCNSIAWMRKLDSIGIMQSIGRTLRPDPNDPNKKYGYILCPIGYDSKNKGDVIEMMRDIALKLYEEGYTDKVIDRENVQKPWSGNRRDTDTPNALLDKDLTPEEVYNLLKNTTITEKGLTYDPYVTGNIVEENDIFSCFDD